MILGKEKEMSGGVGSEITTHLSIFALSQHPVIAISIFADLDVCDIEWDARPHLHLQCTAGKIYLCSRNGELPMHCQIPEGDVMCLQVLAMRRGIVHLQVNILCQVGSPR